MDNGMRDDWLRKRVFELERVIETMIKAGLTEPPERYELLIKARESMPE